MSTLIRHGGWGNAFVNPFRAFDEQFDALARSAFGPESSGAFRPATEVVREGDDAVLRIEVPGIDVEKDIAVEVSDHELTVKGERRDERSSEEGGRRLSEVRYGSFSRSFTLPEHIDAESVSATYDAGVLSVRVPGAYRETASRHIAVTKGGAALPAGEPVRPDNAQDSVESGQDEQTA